MSSGFGEEHRDDGMLFVGSMLGDCLGQTISEDAEGWASSRIQRMDEAMRLEDKSRARAEICCERSSDRASERGIHE